MQVFVHLVVQVGPQIVGHAAMLVVTILLAAHCVASSGSSTATMMSATVTCARGLARQ